MDLSKLSDEDLLALKAGDLSKVSDDGLMAIKAMSQPKPGVGNARDLMSGVNRNIASVGDALTAAYNLMLPKSQEVQPLSQGMSSVGVDLNRPRSLLGMAGEYAMPNKGGLVKSGIETLLAATGGYLARNAAPDSILAEIGGAIALPLAAKTAPSGVAELTRRTMRGADPAGMAARVASADSMKAPLTVGTATQGRMLQLMERLSGSVPGGVNKFRETGEQASNAISARLSEMTGGKSNDVVKTGRTIQRGLFDPDTGWTKKSMDVRDSLYSKLDEKINGMKWWQSRGQPNNYAATVSGAPESQSLWPTPRFDDVSPLMRSTMGPRDANNLLYRGKPVTQGFPSTTEPLNIPAGKPVRSAGLAPGVSALNTAQFMVSANKGVRGAASLSETLFKDAEVQKIFLSATDDLHAGTGRLPYEAIKRLRTEVGDLLGDPQLIGSSRRDLLKKFYAALTGDMKVAAEEAGALKEFNRANTYHKARIERIEDFYETLYKKTTPEDVWSAVIGDNPRSASRISAIRKGLSPDEWGYIRKTVITRMGEPVASAAREGGEHFSAGTFLTNYERMKKTGAVNSIFGTGQYRKDLDQVARYASDLKASADVLANPSGTAGLGLSASVYYGALGMAASQAAFGGNPVSLVGIAGATVANSFVAKLMNSQKFVHWLAQTTKYPGVGDIGVANHMKRLAVIINNDDGLQEAGQAYMDAVNARLPKQ